MIGDRLGKWIIHKELGRGGMGRVYLAQEEIGGRQAALKVLAAELAQSAGFLERFQREIDTLSKLDHPHIVRFYEAGLENGLYFYAMEYVDGPSLEDVLTREGRLSWPDVLDIALQVCPALKHVHDHGVIHRDLKPANLLRTSGGVVKLTDFGIAKVFAQGHLTATGGIVGTAEYLSPEQAAGKPVTKRSDLYSLGAVLYTLLTGRPPFVGDNFLDLLHKHRYGQFDAPGKIVPELPYELDEVICQLLQKDPANRPPDCQVLNKQLDSIRRKLERKGNPTQDAIADDGTVAENRISSLGPLDNPGPATLMSQLMRQELERQNRGSALNRLLNRWFVVIPAFFLVMGALVWAVWPPSAETLFERGAELMQSKDHADWERAWHDYLEPLERNHPDHPHKAEVEVFRKRIEAQRRHLEAISEGQRLFLLGEKSRQDGHYAEAGRLWKNLTVVFRNVEAEKQWVKKAEKGLAELDKEAADKKRLLPVWEALQQAATLRDQGKRTEAEAIWRSIDELYESDPGATEIINAIKAARAK
ncbi:MAG TPA: protein kinase [Gemmataceae bacterium]|nr:protein kinase [Gemmataceae bacterium]